LADSTTTTKSTTKKKAPEDPNAAVLDAIDNLREAMLEAGIDETTVDAKLMSVQPAQTNIVGNFADLQRLGAMQVNEEGGIADAFPAPPPPPTAAAEASAGAVE
jgi:acyl CoA:acetate/3-ketoacid CoA transferase beta subunit